MKPLLLVLWLITAGLFNQVISQQRLFSEEINFATYLIENAQFRDAIIVLENIDQSLFNSSLEKTDSVNFYKGWSYYNIKILDSSSFYLGMVNLESPFYIKSKFYESFNFIYSGNTGKGKSIIQNLTLGEQVNYEQLKMFDLAGIALLERNYASFDSVSILFNYSYFPIVTEQKNFLKYSTDLKSIKRKSPLLAGLMSSVIPGSGKYYAGYRGQAIAAFIPVVTLAGVATENYFRGGPQSIQFIAFASLFSLFYVGNIWGSVLSVKIKRNELYRKIDHEILLDLHLPLRRIFN
ncbi:MAG: hypothetical protein M3Q58_12635 [Bacteroidota bacterium]|nr:hypothetical protein [Bacteroidota bacterium]